MPGGGHVRAANYMANQAPKDGTSIAAIVPAFVTAQVVNRTDAIQFDAAQLNWLGSTNSSNSTVFVMTSTGVKTIEDVKTREILMGGTGAGSYSTLFPVLLNNLIGTRFRVISGYQSTRDVTLAIERGEVQGRAGNNLNSLMQENPDWVRDKKIVILTQVGYERDAAFPDVPLMTELAPDAERRRILEVFTADIVLGRPLLAPPGLPAARLATLRKAFDAAMKDPELLKEAEKMTIDIKPLGGEAIQKIVADFVQDPRRYRRQGARRQRAAGDRLEARRRQEVAQSQLRGTCDDRCNS